MNIIKINNVISQTTTVLSGRPEGEKARANLKLDEIESNDNQYDVLIPERIRTFNVSYFLGLFSISIKILGESKFREKYKFYLENNGQKLDLSETIHEDIEEGIEWALDETEIL